MKKFPWKQIFVLVFLGVGVFIVVEIYKAWKTGVSDLKSLFLSPFTAASKVWSAVTGFFGGLFSGSGGPGTLAGTGQTPAATLGVDANTALGQMLNSEAGQDNLDFFNVPADNSNQLPVQGIWSLPSP